MRYQGKISGWKDDQGFGFVTPNGGGEKAFVHIKHFMNKSRRPAEGMLITYEVMNDEKRRLRAVNIRFADERVAQSTASNSGEYGILIAFSFLIALFLLAVLGKVKFMVPIVYLSVSVLAFIAYGIDKSAAKSNRWRTKESTLHMFGLFCGWPGALVAQKIFHHKSKKQEFQSTFRGTVVVNCIFLLWIVVDKDLILLAKILERP